MGLFSRSNKDKDKKDTDPNKVTIDLEKIKKDKNRYFSYNVYYESPDKKWSIHTTITIYRFGAFLEDMLSNPSVQKDWNAIKEKFGKEVDEKELLKVFKFYTFITYLLNALDTAKKAIIFNAKDSQGYNTYKEDFDGKLDKATFIGLIEKIGKYYYEEFVKKYGQNKEQKDEQPK